MIINIQPGKFWDEGKAVSTLFRRDISVYIYSGADKEYAEKCLRDFNSMPDELISDICRAAIKFCFSSMNRWAEIDKREDVEKALPIVLSPDMPERDILKCIKPLTLSVRESEDGQVGWQVEFDCGWETEKGMEIVVLGGKLIYLGPFADHSPWDEIPANPDINFADNQ